MKPIFTTNQTDKPKPKKTVTKKKAKAKPVVTGPKTLYAADRPWTSKPKGLTNWVGTGAALVRKDVAAPPMTMPEYHAKHAKVVDATDERVAELICEVVDHRPARFGLVGSLKKKHEHGKKHENIELAVFEAEDPKMDSRLVFFDTALIDNVESFYVVPKDFVHADEDDEDGLVNKAVNADKLDDVTLIVAPYWVGEDHPTYKRALRKLGRTK